MIYYIFTQTYSTPPDIEMILTTILAAAVEFTFNVKTENGSPIKNVRLNLVVGKSDYFVQTDNNGVALFTSDNDAAFPAGQFIGYQAIDTSKVYNTFAGMVKIPPPKIMTVEIRMSQMFFLQVTMHDSNTTSRAYNQSFSIYQGSTYMGQVVTNIQGIFSVISG